MDMNTSRWNRRDFNKLTVAALGGAMAGLTSGGCAGGGKSPPELAGEGFILQEPHICRGLNTCKGKGAGGGNDCAGQGRCATAEKHTCKGDNACKGQGGCGEHPGQNSCKAKGACNVPLKDKTWKKARPAFEAAMKKAGKAFGPAPAK